MTAQTVGNAVAKRDEQAGPVKFMWSKRSHLNTVLPKSVDVEAFLGTAAGALYASDVPGKNITLMKCAQANPESLYVALIECAALGHMPGTDEYYLTPRLDHGRPKVLGIEGYKGVVERFYRSGAVANVIVREVCADDPFDYVEGRDDIPRHEVGGQGGTGAAFFGKDGSRNRGQMVGAYAYAKLLTGAHSRVVLLSRSDVLAARDSGGYKPDDSYSPWNRLDGGQDHPEFKGRSMWWKTAAKRLEPWVPTSAEYRREQLRASAAAVTAAERPAITQGPTPPDDVVDAEIVEEPPVAPAPAARLEPPQERRPRQRRQDPAPDEAPWPDGAEPAGPTTSGASSSAHAPGSGSPTATGRQSPSSPPGSASADGDPRNGIIRQFAALGVTTTVARDEYVLQLTGAPGLEQLPRDGCDRLAAALARCTSRADLDALLADGTVNGGE